MSKRWFMDSPCRRFFRIGGLLMAPLPPGNPSMQSMGTPIPLGNAAHADNYAGVLYIHDRDPVMSWFLPAFRCIFAKSWGKVWVSWWVIKVYPPRSGSLPAASIRFQPCRSRLPDGCCVALQSRSQLCADTVLYLLEKTQQHQLAAEVFEEFHTRQRDFLFANLYKMLQRNQQPVLNVLAEKLQADRPIGNLIRSYIRAQRWFGETATWGTRQDFARFCCTRIPVCAGTLFDVSSLADVCRVSTTSGTRPGDQSLADILKNQLRRVVECPDHWAFNLIAELANDLKNYDAGRELSG